jgi:hypothetical protein
MKLVEFMNDLTKVPDYNTVLYELEKTVTLILSDVTLVVQDISRLYSETISQPTKELLIKCINILVKSIKSKLDTVNQYFTDILDQNDQRYIQVQTVKKFIFLKNQINDENYNIQNEVDKEYSQNEANTRYNNVKLPDLVNINSYLPTELSNDIKKEKITEIKNQLTHINLHNSLEELYRYATPAQDLQATAVKKYLISKNY